MRGWEVVASNLGPLVQASLSTIILTVLTALFSTALALPLAAVRQFGRGPWSLAVAAFSWVSRALPLLVVLFFMYYALPSIGVRWGAIEAALVGGSVVSAAYFLEIIRSGLISIPQGQFEAIKALGLPTMRAWRRIIVPQALPVIIPPYFSNLTLVLKGSSLYSVITVNELTGAATGIISLTYRPIELLLFAAGVYLLLNSALMALQTWVEAKWNWNSAGSVDGVGLWSAPRLG